MEKEKKKTEQPEKKEFTREEKLEIEEKALEALLQMGVKFSVPLKIFPIKQKRWILRWNLKHPDKAILRRDKRIPKDWDVSVVPVPDEQNIEGMKDIYMRNFHIKPLYLGTINMIRKLIIEMEYNEDVIQDKPIQESDRLMQYIPLMAKIAAIAIINDHRLTERKTRLEVERLQDFLESHLTVNRLQKLCSVISQMSNRSGFTNSIRLMLQVEAPTRPRTDRVESSD